MAVPLITRWATAQSNQQQLNQIITGVKQLLWKLVASAYSWIDTNDSSAVAQSEVIEFVLFFFEKKWFDICCHCKTFNCETDAHFTSHESRLRSSPPPPPPPPPPPSPPHLHIRNFALNDCHSFSKCSPVPVFDWIITVLWEFQCFSNRLEYFSPRYSIEFSLISKKKRKKKEGGWAKKETFLLPPLGPCFSPSFFRTSASPTASSGTRRRWQIWSLKVLEKWIRRTHTKKTQKKQIINRIKVVDDAAVADDVHIDVIVLKESLKRSEFQWVQ